MNYIYILDDSIIVKPDDPYIETGLFSREKMRPQCHKLLVLLCEYKQTESVATYELIGDTLWRDAGGWGSDKKQSLKDCVLEINKKFNCIKNIRGKGYVLSVRASKIPIIPVYSLVKATTRGWTEYAIENLELKEAEVGKQLEYLSLIIAELIKHIDAYEQVVQSLQNGTEKRIIGNQLFRIKSTVEALKDHIPHRNILLTSLSAERKNLFILYKQYKDNYNKEFDKRLRHAKYELDNLLNWCLEAKIELERDRMALAEYEKLKECD